MAEISGHPQTKGRATRENKLLPKPPRHSSTLLLSSQSPQNRRLTPWQLSGRTRLPCPPLFPGSIFVRLVRCPISPPLGRSARSNLGRLACAPLFHTHAHDSSCHICGLSRGIQKRRWDVGKDDDYIGLSVNLFWLSLVQSSARPRANMVAMVRNVRNHISPGLNYTFGGQTLHDLFAGSRTRPGCHLHNPRLRRVRVRPRQRAFHGRIY
jgi:hypothetical protein